MDEALTAGFTVILYIRIVTEPTKSFLASHHVKFSQNFFIHWAYSLLAQKKKIGLSKDARQSNLQLDGIKPKWLPLSGGTINTFVWKLGTDTPLNRDDSDLLPGSYLHLIKKKKRLLVSV